MKPIYDPTASNEQLIAWIKNVPDQELRRIVLEVLVREQVLDKRLTMLEHQIRMVTTNLVSAQMRTAIALYITSAIEKHQGQNPEEIAKMSDRMREILQSVRKDMGELLDRTTLHPE